MALTKFAPAWPSMTLIQCGYELIDAACGSLPIAVGYISICVISAMLPKYHHVERQLYECVPCTSDTGTDLPQLLEEPLLGQLLETIDPNILPPPIWQKKY